MRKLRFVDKRKSQTYWNVIGYRELIFLFRASITIFMLLSEVFFKSNGTF